MIPTCRRASKSCGLVYIVGGPPVAYLSTLPAGCALPVMSDESINYGAIEVMRKYVCVSRISRRLIGFRDGMIWRRVEEV